MKKILNELFESKTLKRQEAEEVLTNIATGAYTESEIAAFLTVYLMRCITVEELSGFRDALLNLCIRVDLSGFDTIDVCGTGGDGKDTFNISTLSTFVLAGAGCICGKTWQLRGIFIMRFLQYPGIFRLPLFNRPG